MKKNKTILLLLATMAILSGCATIEPVPVKPVELTPVQKADKLFKQGRWQDAFISYSEILKNCEDVKLYRELQVKVASSLYRMQKYPAALAALSPMPEMPASLNDCKKMAMAAQILMAMKAKTEYVESLWEVALDNKVDGDGVMAFKADGYARLGKIYFDNGKNAHAIKCFEYASDLYKKLGNQEKSDNCRNIMEYLR